MKATKLAQKIDKNQKIEPLISGLKIPRSTDWANQASYLAYPG